MIAPLVRDRQDKPSAHQRRAEAHTIKGRNDTPVYRGTTQSFARNTKLAYAYDLTTNPDMYEEHVTAVNGKGRNISLTDLYTIGIGAGTAENRTTQSLPTCKDLSESEICSIGIK